MRYRENEYLSFNITTIEHGISIGGENREITLGDKNIYRLSIGLYVSCINSGRPKLRLYINGSPFQPTGNIDLSLNRTGFIGSDLVYFLPANSTIAFQVVDGSVTLTKNNNVITQYITITSLD